MSFLLPFFGLLAMAGIFLELTACPHVCACTSDDECPHECPCEDQA